MKVTLYGVDGCHKCAFLTSMLYKRGIEFEKISDVQTIIDLDLDSVPAMVVDGNILYEKEAIAWLAQYKKE